MALAGSGRGSFLGDVAVSILALALPGKNWRASRGVAVVESPAGQRRAAAGKFAVGDILST